MRYVATGGPASGGFNWTQPGITLPIDTLCLETNAHSAKCGSRHRAKGKASDSHKSPKKERAVCCHMFDSEQDLELGADGGKRSI